MKKLFYTFSMVMVCLLLFACLSNGSGNPETSPSPRTSAEVLSVDEFRQSTGQENTGNESSNVDLSTNDLDSFQGETSQSENPAPTVSGNNEGDRIVYYTRTGECYHRLNPCGNGTYYPCTLDEALDKGLRPCSKCNP